MTSVLIADDHVVVRKGFSEIISETIDMEVTAEAESGGEVLRLARESEFDVVVLDLNMPGKSGFEVLKQLESQHPDLPVLVLSIHDEDQYAIRVLQAGASGYLTKESAADDLMEAVRRVAEGGKYMSPAVAEDLLDRMNSDVEGAPHELLSDREFQVMRLLASGERVSDIADRLSLSVKTVSTYRSRLLDKMDMDSNADLTRYAIEHDLIN
jgi:two-component system invasion response regulator UvrY